MNLAEFVSAAEQKELELNIPLTPCGGSTEPCPTLCVCSFAVSYAVITFFLFLDIVKFYSFTLRFVYFHS